MAVESPAAFNQNASYAAEQVRRTITSLLSRGSTVGSITGGLVFPGDMQISAGGGMSVNVSTGECWIPGSSVSTQGGYYGRVSSATNLPVAASNPSNPRIDSVTATITDKGYGAASDTFAVQVNTGTPTAGASLANLSGAPALPTSSLLLGYVLVPAGASSVSGGNISNVATSIILQGVSSPPPTDAFQSGVLYTKSITSGDGFVSATPPINSGTGVLTITPNGGWCYVGSPLVRASIPSSSQSVTPPSLPTASGYMAVAIDMVAPTTWGGQVSLAASSGAQQTSLANALANPPALVAGHVRLLDVVILNTTGSYSVAGYRDRRPWAVGAFVQQQKSNGNPGSGASSPVTIDTTLLQARIECSGAPVRITLQCLGSNNTTGAAVGTGVQMDGANWNSTADIGEMTSAAGGQGADVGFVYVASPAAGTHLFAPTFYAIGGGTATLVGSAASPILFTVEEIPRQNANNGTT